MDPSSIDHMKAFVDDYEKDPSILNEPALDFFRNFLQRLGAQIPVTASAVAPFSGKVGSSSGTSEQTLREHVKKARTGSVFLPIPNDSHATGATAILNSLFGADEDNGNVTEAHFGSDEYTKPSQKVGSSFGSREQMLREQLKKARKMNVSPSPDDLHATDAAAIVNKSSKDDLTSKNGTNANSPQDELAVVPPRVSRVKKVYVSDPNKTYNLRNRIKQTVPSGSIRGESDSEENADERSTATAAMQGYKMKTRKNIKWPSTKGNAKVRRKRSGASRSGMKSSDVSTRTADAASQENADARKNNLKHVPTDSNVALGKATSKCAAPVNTNAASTSEDPGAAALGTEAEKSNKEHITEVEERGEKFGNPSAAALGSEAEKSNMEHITEVEERGEKFGNPSVPSPSYDNNWGAEDVDGSDNDSFYLGWQHHGLKHRNVFNKERLMYKSLARWLKKTEFCCILLNPERFDSFNPKVQRLGALLIEEQHLPQVMKRGERHERLYPKEIQTFGPYKVTTEGYARASFHFLVVTLEGEGLKRYMIQARYFASGRSVKCVGLGLTLVSLRGKVADDLEKIEKSLPPSKGKG